MYVSRGNASPIFWSVVRCDLKYWQSNNKNILYVKFLNRGDNWSLGRFAEIENINLSHRLNITASMSLFLPCGNNFGKWLNRGHPRRSDAIDLCYTLTETLALSVHLPSEQHVDPNWFPEIHVHGACCWAKADWELSDTWSQPDSPKQLFPQRLTNNLPHLLTIWMNVSLILITYITILNPKLYYTSTRQPNITQGFALTLSDELFGSAEAWARCLCPRFPFYLQASYHPGPLAQVFQLFSIGKIHTIKTYQICLLIYF